MRLWVVLLIGAVGIGILGLAAHKALSAPLPAGFPPPTPGGQIEIKTYPAYRAAAVNHRGDLDQAATASFGPLFNHISRNEIAMTSPVEARYPQASWTTPTLSSGETQVSFLYRDPTVQPQQVASEVQIVDTPSMTVVSLGLRGSYDHKLYEQGLQQLHTWLAAHPEYEVVGSPRRLFYDGPYVPDPLKRNEVQIPVVLASP